MWFDISLLENSEDLHLFIEYTATNNHYQLTTEQLFDNPDVLEIISNFVQVDEEEPFS